MKKIQEEGSPNSGHWFYQSQNGSDRPRGSTSLKEHDYRRETIEMSSQRITDPTHVFGQYYSNNVVYVGGNGPTPDLNIPNLTTKNIAKLADKVRNSELQLGADLGERHQTFDMVAQNLERIYQAGVSIAHFDVKRAADVLGITPDWHRLNQRYKLSKEMRPRTQRKTLIQAFKDVDPTKAFADLWLEVAFGVEPLAAEIQEAVNQVVVKESVKPVKDGLIMFKATSTYDTSLSYNTGSHRGDVSVSVRIQTRSYFDKEYEPPGLNFLGLSDPSSVLWEITPWSFVWDYFMPIGTYLKAKNFQNNVKPVYSWRTTWIKRTESRYFTTVASHPHKSESSMTIERKLINTAIDWTNDAYLPRIKPISEAFSTAHIHNLLALARQII